MKIYVQSDVQPEKIMRNRGLGDNGRVATFMAETAIRFMQPYTPRQSGSLARPQNQGKHIYYPGPYAHYQYVGEVYGPNIPFGDGSFRSPKGKKKHPTGRKLQHHHGGPYWDKRMMADRGDDFVRAVEAYIKNGG